MPVPVRHSQAPGSVQEGLPALSALVLARVSCEGGATRAEIRRDLQPLLAHRLSPGEWRQAVETTADHLVQSSLARESRGRLSATEAGSGAIARFLGCRAGTAPDWPTRRDGELIARALGMQAESTIKLKALSRPEGVRALVVQKAFGLPLKPRQSPARLRADLAVIALERAFGNKIKSGLGAGAGLSAKAGRVLAGQLAARPREAASDGRLIAHLAAEAVGAPQASLDVLRTAILKRFVTELLACEEPGPAAPPAREAVGGDVPAARAPARSHRPDLDGFVAEVHQAARVRAEGWPGNRKAFISHVWQTIRTQRPEWSLSEVEFKGMLAEAHRAGRLALANADLKDKRSLDDLEASAVGYKNTVWHFVRVEE